MVVSTCQLAGLLTVQLSDAEYVLLQHIYFTAATGHKGSLDSLMPLIVDTSLKLSADQLRDGSGRCSSCCSLTPRCLQI